MNHDESQVLRTRRRRGRPRISGQEEQRIIASYAECDGNAARAAEKLSREGITRNSKTIISVWKRQKLRIRRPGRVRGTERIAERDKLIAEGIVLREIADREGVTHEAIRQYIVKTGQHELWEGAKRRRRNSVIERVIDEGFSLEIIAERMGIAVKTAEKYILHSGRFDDWKAAFQERCEISSIIRQVALQKAAEQGFAYVKALEYHFSIKKDSNNIPFEKLVSFYQEYEDFVKEKGRPPTLTELGREINIFPSCVKQRVQRVNLPVSKNSRGGYLLSFEQKQAIEFAFALDYLTRHDIAHFVGCSETTVKHYFTIMGEREFEHLSINGRSIGYKTASEVYEAADAGFTREEIKEFTGLKNDCHLDFILKNRGEIEPRIIEALNVMFPERRITTPYLSSANPVWDRKN